MSDERWLTKDADERRYAPGYGQEMDWNIALRLHAEAADELIAELAAAIRSSFEFVEMAYYRYDDLAAKAECDKANALLARADALTKDTA